MAEDCWFYHVVQQQIRVHVRAILLSELVCEGQQLIHILIKGNDRILQQLLDGAEVDTLSRAGLDYVEADFVQAYHGADEVLEILLLKQDLYRVHAAFDALAFHSHIWLGEQLFE